EAGVRASEADRDGRAGGRLRAADHQEHRSADADRRGVRRGHAWLYGARELARAPDATIRRLLPRRAALRTVRWTHSVRGRGPARAVVRRSAARCAPADRRRADGRPQARDHRRTLPLARSGGSVRLGGGTAPGPGARGPWPG